MVRVSQCFNALYSDVGDSNFCLDLLEVSKIKAKLTDTWRQMYPQRQDYSFYSGRHNYFARIDLFVLLAQLIHRAVGSRTLTHHSPLNLCSYAFKDQTFVNLSETRLGCSVRQTASSPNSFISGEHLKRNFLKERKFLSVVELPKGVPRRTK